MRREIRLIVSLDTECDKGADWIVRRPHTFLNITQGVPERLQVVFDNYGIKPTYLLSPEVILDKESSELFRSLGDQVELGTHLHSEFIEPESDFDSTRTDAFQSDFEPSIEKAKLENLTSLFRQTFGYSPRSFRAGRFGISRHTLEFLVDLGYLVDSSVTPYKWWWRRKGEGVNFLGAPAEPYRPAKEDVRKRGDLNILEVPLSLGSPFWDRVPRSIQLKIDPINRYQNYLINTVFRNHLRPTWLRPTFSSSEEMMCLTEQIHRKSEHPVLCMMFHSNEATLAMSPYHRNEQDVQNFLDRMTDYFRVLFKTYSVKSIKLSEVVIK